MLIGLVRNPEQPASRHRSSVPFMASAVSAMMGMVWPRSRRMRVAVKPSITGIWMSISTRSNAIRPAASTASLPLRAFWTTAPARLNTRLISLRFESPSSTIRTRTAGNWPRIVRSAAVLR